MILQTLFGFLASLAGTILLCLMIAAFFGWQLYKFTQQTNALIIPLEATNQALAQYSPETIKEEYETFREWSASNALMGEQWRAFTEGLVVPLPHEHLPIQRTVEPHFYFNEASIIGSWLNVRWFASVPSILTGAGLLGTFIGLVAGIFLAQGGLASQETEQMHQALGLLLGGASTAFWTSIVGISLSMIFSWREKNVLRHCQENIDKINTALRNLFPKISVEQLAHESIRELTKQTEQLEHFNTDLATSIGQALDKSISTRLTPEFHKLVDTLNALRADRTASNEAALERMVSDFGQLLQSSTGDELKALAGTLEALNANLMAASHALATDHSQRQAEIDQFQATFGAMMQQIGEQTQLITNSLRSAGDSIQNNLNNAFQGLDQQMEFAGQKLVNLAGNAGEQLTTGAESFLETLRQLGQKIDAFSTMLVEGRAVGQQTVNNFKSALKQFSDSLGLLQSTHNGIRGVVSNLTETTRRLERLGGEITSASTRLIESAEHVGRASHALAEHNTELTKTWHAQRERFEGLDAQLAAAFREINEGIEAYTEQVREFVKELDEQFSGAVTSLSGAVGELSDLLDNMAHNGVRTR